MSSRVGSKLNYITYAVYADVSKYMTSQVSPGNHETYLPQAPSAAAATTTNAAATDGTDTETGVPAAAAAAAVAAAAAAAAVTTGEVKPPRGFLSEHDQLEAGADGSWNFTAFDHRFNMPSNRSNGVANMWYSFDYGGVHFVSINTETDFPKAGEKFLNGWGAQLSWLETDLQAYRLRAPHGWLIAVGHKPMYSSAPGYTDLFGRPDAGSKDIQAAFEPLFEKYSVHLYLSGHQHGYERSAPISSNKPTAGATTHIVAAVPGGGCGITADWKTPRPRWNVAQWPDGSPWNDHQNATGEEASLGYGVLTTNVTAMRWDFYLSESGILKDSVTIVK